MKIQGFDEALAHGIHDLDVKKYGTEKKPTQSIMLITDTNRMKGRANTNRDSSNSDDSSVYKQHSSSGSEIEGNEFDIIKVKVEQKDGKKPKIEYRQRGDIKDNRSHTDKFVDKYFSLSYKKMLWCRPNWNEMNDEEKEKVESE